MALLQLNEEQIRTWTRAQKDEWWLKNVYRLVDQELPVAPLVSLVLTRRDGDASLPPEIRTEPRVVSIDRLLEPRHAEHRPIRFLVESFERFVASLNLVVLVEEVVELGHRDFLGCDGKRPLPVVYGNDICSRYSTLQ